MLHGRRSHARSHYQTLHHHTDTLSSLGRDFLSFPGLSMSSRIFFTIFTFLFYFLFHPLYPTFSLSLSFHTLTSNDKTIEHDNIGTLWPSNTWWPKELLYRMLHRPKNIRRSVPHRPLPRRDSSPHQAGDSQEESPRKPMPPLPA